MMTSARAFSLAVTGWTMAMIGCNYDCPTGFVQRAGSCVVAPDSSTAEPEHGETKATRDGGESLDASESHAPRADAAVDSGSRAPARDTNADASPKGDTSAKDAGPSSAADSGGAAPHAGGPAREAADAGMNGAPVVRPNFVHRGGAVLKHLDVALLFWGAEWSASSQVTAGQIAGALQHMLAGPYFANLNQYGELSYPALTWVSTDTSASPPSRTPSMDDVARYINARLDASAAPALGGDQLLVVVLPPSASAGGALGERGRATYKDSTYRYAWVASAPTVHEGLSATYAIARHIVLSMSNPNGDGWVDANSGKGLTDVCGWSNISDVAYPQYWSNADARCVVPREYAALLRYDGQPNAWTQIWSHVRSAACGGYGLVATGADDNVFKFNGQPDNWIQIGLPAAQHVVGPDSVYGLTPDLSGIYRYSGSGSGWSKIGTQSVTLFAGGFGVFATELGSNRLKKWSGDDSTWTDFGGPGASFAVGRDFIAGIPLNHSSVWRSTGDTNWTQIKTSAANQLYSSGDSSFLGATDPGDLDNIYLFREGTTWARQGSAGYTFALTSRELFGLTPSRWGVFQSTDLGATSPDWAQIDGPVHNLVNGCDAGLYALKGLIQCDEGSTGSAGSSCPTTIGR